MSEKKLSLVGAVGGLAVWVAIVVYAVMAGAWTTFEDVTTVTVVLCPIFVGGGIVFAHSAAAERRRH
jgi:hypothetical protein